MERYAEFVKRSRVNLHVVLCMSPTGEAFRSRLRTFPALINCTTIDWFLPWPAEALRSIAHQVMPVEIIDVAVEMQDHVSILSDRYY